MSSETPSYPEENSKGLFGLVKAIVAPDLVENKYRKRELRWKEYAKKQVEIFRNKFQSTPEMKKKYEDVLSRYGLGEREWVCYMSKNGLIMDVDFDEPKVMRGILESEELRPKEMWVYEGRLDDNGLPGRIVFSAGEVDSAEIRINYENYIYSHGDTLLNSNEKWRDLGYEKIEAHLYRLKE